MADETQTVDSPAADEGNEAHLAGMVVANHGGILARNLGCHEPRCTAKIRGNARDRREDARVRNWLAP
jgi:hypothetical protein